MTRTVVVAIQGLERGRQLGDERLVERVVQLGAVHPDRRDAFVSGIFEVSYTCRSLYIRKTPKLGLRRSARSAPPKAEAEHPARLGRIDDAVVPQPRGGVVGVALRLVLRRGSAP